MPNHPIIPCEKRPDWSSVVEAYADALRLAAHSVGLHGMDQEAFEESGLFQSAIERLRGQRAATTNVKYAFIASVLTHLQANNWISSFRYVGGAERHDYEVEFSDGRICCIEAKGCLDGNNTNIFIRPPNADEFVIWSLCQNPGSDPRHNAWSGIHTRLGTEIIARKERVDGLVIWDMLCGSLARKCPKLEADAGRATVLNDKPVPPPCLYLFPRLIPDARNNPSPRPWALHEVRFLQVLSEAFKGVATEAIAVSIEARMVGNDVQRRTTFTSSGSQLHQSGWTPVRRAS